MNILITGLGGSGKTTYAKVMECQTGCEVIHTDDYRFGENWRKKPYEEYHKDLFDRLNENDKPKIIEGICFDARDDGTRCRVFSDLLDTANKVIIIRDTSKVSHIENVINRSIRRATGEEEQGTCVESSSNRAHLVIKCVEHYDQNIQALEDLKKECQRRGIEVSCSTLNISKILRDL